jgi:hypothetical protein
VESFEIWSTTASVPTAGTDEDAIAAELAIQAASALQVLDLDTVYEARFDILPPGDEPPNLPEDMRRLEVRCRLMQYAHQTTPVFPLMSSSAARAAMMHVLEVATNPHYEPQFHYAETWALPDRTAIPGWLRQRLVGRAAAARRCGLGVSRRCLAICRRDLPGAVQRVQPLATSIASFRGSASGSPPPAGGQTSNWEMSLAEARLALPDLEREVNESLSELALPDLRAQVQAETGMGFATYLDITWMILGTLGSCMGVNADYNMAKIVLLRHLRKMRGSGESEAEPALRDEAVAFARWCVALEYDRAATDFVEAGESKDNSAWVIDLKDDRSRYRVTIPHGETRRSRFNLERRPLE